MPAMDEYVRVDMALTTPPFAAAPSWTNVTSFVKDLEFSRIRTGGPGGPVAPGRLTVTLDNRDGRFDPSSDYASSPFAANIDRDRLVRVLISDDGFVSNRLMGYWFIDGAEYRATQFDATAKISASDAMRILQEYELRNWGRDAEMSGDRFSALLTEVGIPDGTGSTLDLHGTIDAGTVWVQDRKKRLGNRYQGSALAVAQELMRAEGGLMFVDTNGQLQFRDRYDIMDRTEMSVSQQTIGQSDFLASPALPSAMPPRYVVAVSASGATGDVVTYDSGAATNFPTTNDQQLEIDAAFDADVLNTAEFYQKIWERFNVTVPSSVDVWVASPGGTNSTMLTAFHDRTIEMFYRVRLDYQPPGYTSPRQYDARVEGIAHRITPSRWVARLHLSMIGNTWQTATSNFFDVGTTIGASETMAI